ncbi:hypothetical protein ACX0HA_10655 [Flavobacterium hauense]
MKKITRPLFAAAVIAIASVLSTGCSKKEVQQEKNGLHVAEKLLTDEEKQAYMNQMSLVTSTEDDRKKDTTVTISNIESADDSKIDWTFFDKQYNEDLSNPEKQEIAYIILCKKDLIGKVNKNPDNAELVAALKKYTDVLVKTEYIGYTSLYYALKTLKPIDEVYTKEKAAAILKYAKHDTTHTDFINDKEFMKKEKKTYDRFVENFKYVSRIGALS